MELYSKKGKEYFYLAEMWPSGYYYVDQDLVMGLHIHTQAVIFWVTAPEKYNRA